MLIGSIQFDLCRNNEKVMSMMPVLLQPNDEIKVGISPRVFKVQVGGTLNSRDTFSTVPSVEQCRPQCAENAGIREAAGIVAGFFELRRSGR